MGTLTNGHHRWPRGLVTLRGYQRPWLRGDLIAGLTVAAYLVPQVMAYAGVAGLPPVTGLWAALAPLACYAVLGSSRLVSLGPESTTALMTAVAIGPLAAGDPSRYAALAAMLALLVGLLAVVAWLVRLGFVADLLSRPVLVGYLAGVALIMMAGQLGRLTGVRVTGESFTGQVASFTGRLAHVNPADVVIAAAVLVLLFTAQSRWPRLPGPLAAVLLSTAVCAIFSLGQHGVALVGHIPAGLPTPGLPKVHLSEVRELILPALGMLLVAFSDDVLTARAFERGGEMHRRQHRASGPRRVERRSRPAARLPDQQQRQQDRHRAGRRGAHPGVFADRTGLDPRRPAVRAPGAGLVPGGRAGRICSPYPSRAWPARLTGHSRPAGRCAAGRAARRAAALRWSPARSPAGLRQPRRATSHAAAGGPAAS